MTDRVLVRDLMGTRKGVIERIVPGLVPAEWEEDHVARYQWAAQQLEKLGARKVLDVACGVGYGSDILRQAGLAVVSTDRYGPGLRFGKQNFEVRTPVLADAHRLPFGPGCFDAVVCFETIEHLDWPGLFLRGIAHLLKAKGTLLLSTPNRELSDQSNPHHLHEFTVRELLSLLQGEGFTLLGLFVQRPILKWGFWQHVMGLRRIEWEVRRSNVVRRYHLFFRTAPVWCVKAVLSG